MLSSLNVVDSGSIVLPPVGPPSSHAHADKLAIQQKQTKRPPDCMRDGTLARDDVSQAISTNREREAKGRHEI